MGLLHPISRVLKSELPLCGARCRDGHACRAKAAWDGVEPYNGRCWIHGGLSTGPRTQEGRDRLSAATKKMWVEHREERRALISAGVRRYWDAVRQCAVTIMKVEAGLAWHYKRYEQEQSDWDRVAYARAEVQARAERRGLWRDPEPVPPWDFRRPP